MARSEERDERPEQQQRKGVVGRDVGEDGDRRSHQVQHVRTLAAEGIAGVPERHVPEPHSDLHRKDKSRHREGAQPDAAFAHRQGQIRGNPEVQAPPAEHRAPVHQRHRDGERKQAAAKNIGKAAADRALGA